MVIDKTIAIKIIAINIIAIPIQPVLSNSLPVCKDSQAGLLATREKTYLHFNKPIGCSILLHVHVEVSDNSLAGIQYTKY